MRTGLVAKKVGMSCFFDQFGKRIPVTLLKLESSQVIENKTKEKHGYSSIVIGYGDVKNLSKIKKPLKGRFLKLGLEPKKRIKEFRSDSFIEVGQLIDVTHFSIGQYIDVRGTTIGKGFAGSMKRHGFSGLEASHGVSISHRSHGSTGGRTEPGKVFKNKKMAGHMGNCRNTVLNLLVLDIDTNNNMLIVKGSVPGYNGNLVFIRDAIKK